MAGLARCKIELPSGAVLPVTAKHAAIWSALVASHPEPVCVGTLARMMWPADDLPPLLADPWRHVVAVHISSLRRALRGSGVSIVRRVGHRYQLFSSRAAVPPGACEGGRDVPPQAIPAAHLQHRQQKPGDVGQQNAGQQHQQETVEQRGANPAVRQSVISGSQSLHGATLEDVG
jgi:DNA-binding winged helix-turn-helix (wHTH) protein